MICRNDEHYPTDRPLTILTTDPRLHFPDADPSECIEGPHPADEIIEALTELYVRPALEAAPIIRRILDAAP